MKRIRSSIEPHIMKAEFEFDGRNKFTHSGPAWLDYSRPGLILRCLFDPNGKRLVAETMDDNTECKIVTNIELRCPSSTATFVERVDEFTNALREFLQTLPAVVDTENGSDAAQ